MPRLSLLVLGAVAALLSISPATAQQRYELQADGDWQAQAAPDPDSPAGRLQAIRRQLANGEPAAAEEAASQWIEQHPEHDLLAEARLVRGDARTAQGHYYDALYDYEYIALSFPGSDQFHTALQREYEIARLFVHGTRRHFLGLRILPAYGDGEELLIRIQERAPGSRLGERASLELANYYYREREMTSAAEAYQLFLENYPESDHAEWARLRLVETNLLRFKGPRFDATGLIEAAQHLETYREQYPAAADEMQADARMVRINESLAHKALLTAQWYQRRGETVSAAYLYNRLVRDYPETAAAGQALDRLDAIPEAVRGEIHE